MKAAAIAVLAAALPLALSACLGSGEAGAPPAAVDCAELSDSVFPGVDSAAAPMYKVIAPNGGETFKVGETMRVLVAGAGSVATSQVRIFRISRGGSDFADLPGLPSSSFDPRKQCEFTVAVPESLSSGAGAGGKFSLVSDSLRLSISHYSLGADYFDFSDSLFRVIK
jgi:hypothetical protein